MGTHIAPNEQNTVRLGNTLQVRIDVRDEAGPGGTARLRGWVDAGCRGTAIYDQKQNLAEYHARVRDADEALDFVVLIFGAIPPRAYLRLDCDTPEVGDEPVFQV